VDGDDNSRYLVLTLGSSGEGKPSFAELYYDFSEAKKVFTAFPLYEDMVSGCDETDDTRFKKFGEEQGFYYHEELYQYANSFDKLLPYMMMYALSSGGEAEVSLPDDFFYEDFIDEEESPELSRGKLFWCHSSGEDGMYVSHFDTYFICSE
jgi:hypothetical protein